MANTPNLGLPLLEASQAQKHVTVNESLTILDTKLGGSFAAGGAASLIGALSEELDLTGSSVTSTIEFPASCVILAASTLVTEAITGATTFKVGDSLVSDLFGDLLGVSLGSANSGLLSSPSGNPTALPVVITANGSNFTGGRVRLALHYILIQPPTS